MKKTYSLKAGVIAFAFALLMIHGKAQTFTQGNIAVFVAGASVSNTTGSIVELNTSSPGQTAINTYNISGTGASAMRFSGSATSTGYLANSNDGTLLCFTGVNNTNTGSNVNTLNPRAVGTLSNDITFNLATTYTGSSGDQTRCATSLNNTNWFIGDQGGLHTNSSTSPSPAANLRGVKSFGGTVYVGQASSTGTIIQVSTASAPSGGSITGLPGLTNNSSMQDFYLISSGSNGTSFDILYVVSATSNTAGTITKYSLVSGSWTSNGSYTTTFGGFGMAAKKQDSGAYLFVSSGQGALTANNVIRLTDANGYNSAISITTGNNVTLYTAAAGTIVKGVAFAPANACTAPAIASVSNNGPVCEGSNLGLSVSATGTATLTYQWSGPNGFTSTDQNPAISNATTDATGTYTVTVTNSCGSSSSSTNATVGSSITPVVTPNGTIEICSGNSVSLDAGSGYSSYLWSTGEITQAISVNSAGDYSVTVSNGSCSGTSAVVTVAIISAPAQPGSFTSGSAGVNAGQTGVVYAVPNVPGVTYNWSYNGTGATINGSGNSVTVDFAPNATSGTLSVTASNSCGTGPAQSMTVTVTPLTDLMRITEYMYNGLGAGSAGEFVEFTNVGSAPVDMTGWSFDDNSRVPGSQSLTGFGIVEPGESVIMTDMNSGAFRTNWNLCNGIKIVGNNTNNLGREDEINLYDGSGTLVDRLTYGDQTFAPGSIRTSGTSGWVNAAGLGNNQISQWVLSVAGDAEASYSSAVAEKGSPGKSTRATVSYDPCFVANGAPTIVINTSATSDYLDGGATTSPISPYGLSGVISDAKDPLVLYGVDFTIGDDVTPVNSLSVTVASGNTTVVPSAGLVLTGTGASRNLKITPAAVGYSLISVTVNDGLLNTVYVINFAASDAAPPIIPANTAWHTGMSDASTGFPIDSSYGIIADDELNVLNVYSRSESGLPVASYNYTSNLALPNPSSPEVDVEGHAPSPSTAGKIYWTGSMSNGKLPYDNKPNRDRLFATTVSGTGAATVFSFNGYYNLRSALLAWGDANGYDFTASATAGVNPKGIAGFSLEGMCFGPDGTTLYLALRAPLVPTSLRHNAVIAPIVNFETWFNNGSPSGAPTFGVPIELDLDFRGIREITRLSNGTYVVIAGSPIEDGGVNNIYKWTGYASDAPVPVANDAGYLLNLEGTMQVSHTSGQPDLTKLQVITDGGAQVLYQDNSEAKDLGDLNLRKYRTDVLENIDLDICSGFSATITPSGSTHICPGNSVTLTAPAGTNRTYLWSNGATTQSVSASAFQSYTVTVTQTTSGCTATSAPVQVTNALPSDFNADHVTDNFDFLSLLGMFNQSCSGCVQDLNHDGVVDNVDFLILLGQFNQTCP